MGNIGFWNVKGLNRPHKHGDVRWLLNQHSLGLVGLLDTRVKAGNFNKVFPRVCDNWSVITNYHIHRGGRIWVVWLPSKFNVNVIEVTTQFIHVLAHHTNIEKNLFVTMVYGAIDAGEKRFMEWVASNKK